jgi:uncharacterized membrane protein
MPFCSHCGNTVGERDIFCAGCGGRQPVSTPPPGQYWLGNITPRTAAILCYIPVVGWIAAVVVLAANKFRTNRTLRFHAFQGLYLFVAWLIVSEVIGPAFHPFRHFFGVEKLLNAGIIFLWIFMIVKTSHDQVYSLPVIGELAERSVAEH